LPWKFSPFSGKLDYYENGTAGSGFTGTLADSTLTPIAEVSNGLIQSVYFPLGIDGLWNSITDNWDSILMTWDQT
jgi:hypothetical protein